MEKRRFYWNGSRAIEMTGITRLTKKDLKRVVRLNRLVEIEEVQKEFRKFRVLIPVRDLGWEGRNIDGVPVDGTTLAKQLAQRVGLVHLPQTHDLQTKGGMKATYGVKFGSQGYNNSEDFFFIREDILQAILSKNGWTLVWAIWGEREVSNKQVDLRVPTEI